MRRSFIALSLIAACALGAAAKTDKKDPVVMTVAGKDVRLSEFEYLYHKNASQQVESQTLDEYVDMFVNYKLKVAAAEAAGIDTTEAFVKEFEGYRSEIAAPYLVDKAMADSLMQAALSHFATNVDVSHIMFAPGEKAERIDSVYQALSAGADFSDLAARYSTDRATATHGGRLGFITAGRLPYAFEDAAYNTPVGSISKPFATQFGTHIVLVNDSQPDPGQTHCRHILKLTRGLDATAAAAKRAEIDSIARVLAQGADFAAVASVETEDPSGRQSGGDLPWFGPGMMVKEFETAALALKPGEISGVVTTDFGYHLIYCEDRRDVPPAEELTGRIETMMKLDGRDLLPRQRYLDAFRASRPDLAHVDDLTLERAAIDALPASRPDYRNLLNEYRDGMLLYEISTREVWGRSSADSEGLREYFAANRDRYAFTAPRYKGYVVVAATDSLGTAATEWLAAEGPALEPSGYAAAAKARFGAGVRIEHVLAAKGENPIIDHLVFGAEAPEPNSRWAFYAPYAGRVIEAPEEPSDAGASVSTDYQQMLEQNWLADLRSRFAVSINRKALKKVRQN